MLSSKFVNDNKDKATITVQLEVDEHLTHAHKIDKGGDDGDVHMAGRADEVRLPLVAEILNAAKETSSMQLLNQSSATSKIAVKGVWRLWFEHPSPDQMIQGNTVAKPIDSNPDHVFEIHPITQFGNNSVVDSFAPIANKTSQYTAYPAATAFPKYEALKSTIKNNGSAISITSTKAGYNYTEFIIELAAKPTSVSDGFLVLAKIIDVSDEEEPVVDGFRRMVFVNGTGPAKKLVDDKMGKGDRLHVMGIPRVNLTEVAAAANAGKTVNTRLPYEMIIVAVFPE
ncbi:MAG: hypothetical protein WA672_09180 [Candidatus Angelobacter sp.]